MAGWERHQTRRDFMAATTALGVGGLLAACGADDSGSAARTSTTRTGAPVPEPTGVLVTRWRQDPFALGSYSYLAIGAEPEDRVSLAEPVDGRLFFAGEATHDLFPATVHGALLSGRRAAEEVAATGAGRVAVIGAGVAGLGGAQLLADEGREVTVYEARDRLGGRVWTDRSLGVPLDMGASWIHGVTDNPLTDIADAASIERRPTDYDNASIRDARGRIVGEDDLPRSFQEVAMIEHEYGADVDDLAPEAFEEGAELGGGDVVFPGGYDQILDSLTGGYAVELSSPVETISHGTDPVLVSVGGAEQQVDAVIVTVPLGVLKAETVSFDPPLPEAKQRAIGQLGMGLLDKVYLRFDDVFWDEEAELLGYVGPERGHFAEWQNLATVTGEPILLGFNASSAAEQLETLPDDGIVAAAMTALRDMYG